MSGRKGFTLIEIIVAMVIMGILACVAVPIYGSMIEKGMAQAASNNLTIIATAQRNYYFNKGTYCVPDNTPTDCGYSLTTLNNNLGLNIPNDTNYNYGCFTGGPPGPSGQTGFMCTASRTDSGPSLVLAIFQYPPTSNNPQCVGGSKESSYCPY